jgi:hypothetical protein
MEISVTQPLERAWDRMVQVCFRPFDIGKWFTLGFCAWLAALGSGGGCNGGGSGDNNSGGGGGGGDQALEFVNRGLAWCAEHAVLVIGGVALLFLIGLAASALILWLRSRGDFMFIDGIVKDRGAVVEPWREYKSLGDSVFVVRMGLSVIGAGWFFLMVLYGLFSAWPAMFAHFASVGNDPSFAELFPGEILMPMVVFGGLTLALMLLLGLASAVIDHLVVPVMYGRDLTAGAAWSAVRTELLPGHLGTIVLFYLMMLVVGLGLALVGFVVMLLTCCIAALPYIGAVILLPLAVFKRSYVLYFVEQFGFDIFRAHDPRLDGLGASVSARI